MHRPEGYRLRDMTRVGKVSLAVAALAFAFLIIGSAVSEVGPSWWLLLVVLASMVIALASEARRLARQGLPFMWR